MMGSAASRAKRVAPALERTDLDGGRLFCTTTAPKRPQQGCLSLGQCSDGLSTEERLEEEEGEEVDRVHEPCENTDSRPSKRLVQKAFFRSGLCFARRGQSGSDTTTNITTLVHNEGLRRGHHAFEHREATCPKPLMARTADPVCTKAASVVGLCDHPSLAMPFFYDASEEDLMNVIEREFG